MNKKLLLSFALAAAMTGCINDADVPSGNGDNPATGARGGNMEISFLVPNSSNGRPCRFRRRLRSLRRRNRRRIQGEQCNPLSV